jgi:hypothetical protein
MVLLLAVMRAQLLGSGTGSISLTPSLTVVWIAWPVVLARSVSTQGAVANDAQYP